MLRIHGTCVALSGLGVLLRGPPGSGKSDLALRLIDGGGLLVADDQVEIDEAGHARAPALLKGLIEIRGLGILPVPAAPSAPLGLVADLVPWEGAGGPAERLSAPRHCRLGLLALPLLALDPFQASAPARLRLAASLTAEGRFAPVPAALADFS